MVALHYKLMMEDKDVNNPQGQIAYVPLLDADRDEKILRVLPSYLTDEIMFAREQGIPPDIGTIRLMCSEYVLLATQPVSSEKGGLRGKLLYIMKCTLLIRFTFPSCIVAKLPTLCNTMLDKTPARLTNSRAPKTKH